MMEPDGVFRETLMWDKTEVEFWGGVGKWFLEFNKKEMGDRKKKRKWGGKISKI